MLQLNLCKATAIIYFLLNAFCPNIYTIGLATNIEEYEPMIMPSIMAMAKS